MYTSERAEERAASKRTIAVSELHAYSDDVIMQNEQYLQTLSDVYINNGIIPENESKLVTGDAGVVALL